MGLIVKVYARKAGGIDAFLRRAAQMEAIELATGRTAFSAALACLPYTMDEIFPRNADD